MEVRNEKLLKRLEPYLRNRSVSPVCVSTPYHTVSFQSSVTIYDLWRKKRVATDAQMIDIQKEDYHLFLLKTESII